MSEEIARSDRGPRRAWRLHVYVLAILIGFLAFHALLDLPHDVQHWSADLMTANFSQRAKHQNPDIVLIYVSRSTLDGPPYYPYVSPIDRKLLADLVSAVDGAGPRAIGFDFILDRLTVPDKDALLRDVLRHAKAPLVFGAIDEPINRPHVESEYFLAKGVGEEPRIGHIYFDQREEHFVVSDHVVRSIAELPKEGLKLGARTGVRTSFSEAVVRAAGFNIDPQPANISWLFPRSADIAWLLPPDAQTETFLTLPAEAVLDQGSNKLPLTDLLGGKIVLIGGNFDDRDQHVTPLSVSRDDFFPGLFIHAQRAAQLKNGRYLYEFALPAEAPILLGAGLLGYVLGRRSGDYYLWLELGTVAVLVLIGFGGFLLFGAIFPYTLVVITWLAGAAIGHYGRAGGHKSVFEASETSRAH
jgi:adenylate cyclase